MTDKLNAERLRGLHEQANSKSLHPEDCAAARFALKTFVCGPDFPAILAMAEDNARLREALERAALRLDMLVEGNSAFAVTKWTNEAHAAALGKDQA